MLKFFKVNEKGLSAVELIIALAISLLVVAAAGFILLTQSGVIRLNKSVSTEQQRLNTAFNTVRYSLRMAGFDYGQSFYIQAGTVPPVQVVDAAYPTNPYEVLVSYSAVVNGSSPCVLTPNANVSAHAASAIYNLGANCNINNFYSGQLINITNPIPLSGQVLPPPPIILCVTKIVSTTSIQVNPGNGNGHACSGSNPIPPNNVGRGNVSSVNQILFYWGNTAYNFNPPFDVPGNLYECMVNPIQLEPPAAAAYAAPTCAANTTITLSDYINSFAVNPLNQLNQYNQPYLYTVSITGESNVAISDSPAYSVHTAYNANAAGVSPRGTNILKTLNSSVFLRNVYYGS